MRVEFPVPTWTQGVNSLVISRKLEPGAKDVAREELYLEKAEACLAYAEERR